MTTTRTATIVPAETDDRRTGYLAMAAKYDVLSLEAKHQGNDPQADYWANEAAAYRLAAS